MSHVVSYEHMVSISVVQGRGIQFMLSHIDLQVRDSLTLRVDVQVPHRPTLHVCSALTGGSWMLNRQLLRNGELDVTRTQISERM